MVKTEYLIALGSNQRHHRHGGPRAILMVALQKLDKKMLTLRNMSRIMSSRPIGPSNRTYANAAALIESDLDPRELLSLLKDIESQFGSRKGQRWSKRTLDLDIILSKNGVFQSTSPDLFIPHPAMRQRHFVLKPAAEIAPQWRDPITNLTIQHLVYRLKRGKPLDPKQKHY